MFNDTHVVRNKFFIHWCIYVYDAKHVHLLKDTEEKKVQERVTHENKIFTACNITSEKSIEKLSSASS